MTENEKTTINSLLLLLKVLGVKKEPISCVNKRIVYLLFLCNIERLMQYGTPISDFFCTQRKVTDSIAIINELLQSEPKITKLDLECLAAVDILAIEDVAAKFGSCTLSEIREEVKRFTYHPAPFLPHPKD